MKIDHQLLHSATLAFLLVLVCASASQAGGLRSKVVLTQGWQFARTDVPDSQFATTAWRKVSVPHCWNDSDGTTPGYYRGPATYRLHFDRPSHTGGKRLFLRFEAVAMQAQVWLNGHRLGQHKGGFTAFCFEITPYIRDKSNELVVRASNAPDSTIMPLDGDFTMHGGIYRPVWFLALPATCVTPLDHGASGVYISQLQADSAVARLEVLTKVDVRYAQHSKMQVRTLVIAPDGKQVACVDGGQMTRTGALAQVRQHVAIDHPVLWQGKKSQRLYRFETQVLVNGRLVDTLSQQLGLRSFSIDAHKGFSLNGHSWPLRGVNRHQDRPGKGWALSNADHDQDMHWIKTIGANAVRLAHYPQSDYFYSLCDREGILVWAEIPYIGRGSYGSAEFEVNALAMLRELILQNYNHCSIFCWSLFNELGGKGRPDLLVARLNELAHSLDSTRVTVAAVNNDGRPENDMPDIIAYNTYPGWYWAEPNTMGVCMDWKYDPHRDRCVGVSEYGAGASITQHQQGMPHAPKTDGAWHPEEWQAIVHEGNYHEILRRPWLWGTFVWNMFDFASAGRHEGATMGINDKGLVTYDRTTAKDAFFYYQAQWADAPMVHIASKRDSVRTSGITDVKVYSNCPTVRLWVNGQLQPAVTATDHVSLWHAVSLQPGQNDIKAEALSAAGDTVTDACQWQLNSK